MSRIPRRIAAYRLKPTVNVVARDFASLSREERLALLTPEWRELLTPENMAAALAPLGVTTSIDVRGVTWFDGIRVLPEARQ